MKSQPPENSPPFNAEILRWAREWHGKTIQEAAAKLKKKPDDIADWENNVGAPTVKQARTLAQFYGRHFLEFFLPSPPNIKLPELVPDFRTHAGVIPPPDNRELQEIQQWAETQRVNALDLFEELGERPRELKPDLFSERTTDPELAARSTRSGIRFSIREQITLPREKTNVLPEILRSKFEDIGILTLRHGKLRRFGIRGVCIAQFPLPIIIITNEAPTAQAFTLVHELGHILLKESGITGTRDQTYENQPVERWCDRFAASFLMPAEEIETLVGKQPNSPSESIADSTLEQVANYFRVSQHAALIRLVQLGFVNATYYWNVKKKEYDQQDSTFKTFGRSQYYGSRYKSQLGNLYTSLVLEAWATGRITNHNAAEYMGIKNIGHLYDIRRAVSGS